MFPSRLKFTKTCQRCAMQYGEGLLACPHCLAMSDVELNAFMQRRADELTGIKHLGRMFLVVAAVLLVFSVMAFVY